MTFLNPAILFGLLAASIPIVLHFLNLRKLKKVEFSTLAFLKELQKTKIKRIKFKQWLLLLLRIAIIIFLVAAFARPTLKDFSFGSSSTAKTTAVIILDNTFSMSVVSEKGSYLNQAKQSAKNLINNFQDGDEIAFIPIGDISDKPGEPTTNFKQTVQTIDEVQISSVSGTINRAIVKAAQILYASKNFNKEIYLITDLQAGRIVNSLKDIPDLSGILMDNTRLFLVHLHAKEAVNLGIEELRSNNQIYEKGKTVSFSAKIKNYSPQPVNNSVVSLFINGKRNAQQSLHLLKGEIKDISFETTLADTGLVEIAVELEDDDILQDNKRDYAVYVPDKISLVMLTDLERDSRFIRLAAEDPGNKVNITGYSISQMPSINLKKYDAVFVLGSEKNNDWKNLTDYIQRGGRAVIMPGSQSTIRNFQNLCNAVSIPIPSAPVGKLNSPESPSQFDRIDFQNPIFSDLFENYKQPQIASPDIYYYFKIFPSGIGKNIISMIDKSSFVSEYKIGKGKVILFNSAPVLSWSNFPLKGFFAPMVMKLIYYSGSNIKEENDNIAGQEIVADISGHSTPQIVIQKPGGVKEFINADSLSNKNFLFYTKTDEPGVYKFSSGGKLLDYSVVSHDPRESVTDKADDSEFEIYLKQIGFSGRLVILNRDDDFSKEIYQSRFGTELWKYFLVLVLFLAILESIIARSSKKELAELGN